ncbi:WD40 repeat-like protein [Schizophyllum commune H4-8]|uniref:WD40 repeat-like protein n=1 Tax=Schizophyllum commune (strain H4-8 / FGSC 9210) TaxID=578458 RepID=UPI00215E203F|nr:WD40 repeat-like protein [Schizophyllum commune H4-8]KAI5892225.1 WD40 repeat-like protein [Schizophyllum commune H4-8]
MLALYTFRYVSGENIPRIPKTSYRRKQYRRIYATCAVDDGESKHLALSPNSTISIPARNTSTVHTRLYAEHKNTSDELIASKDFSVQEVLFDQPFRLDLADEQSASNVSIHLTLRITTEDVGIIDSAQLTTVFSLSDKWKRMDKYVRLALQIGSVPAEINPISKAILKLLSIGADEFFRRLERNDAVLSLVEEMGQASEYALNLDDPIARAQRIKQKAARDALIMHIYRCLIFLRNLTSSGMTARLSSGTNAEVEELIKGLKACAKAVERKGHMDTQLSIFRTERLAKEIVDERTLERLPYAKEVHAGTTSSCLPGTRVNLLREIEDWAFDPDGQRALILYGAAGKGKSAVAHAVAMRLRGMGTYAPFFAFDRTARDREAYQLLPTLAVQLARRNKECHDILCKMEADDLSTRDIKDQSDRLVVGLLPVVLILTPLVLVIDALDECPNEDATDETRSLRLAADRRTLLETLNALIADERLPRNVRLLITTRPDDDIRLYVAHPTPLLKLCSIDGAEDTDRDIRLFVEEKLSRTAVSGMIDDVVAASQTLFECAALLCRELTKVRKPRVVLRRDDLVARVMRNPGQALYTTYRAILESHFDVDDVEVMAAYRRILAWILLAETPQRRETFSEIAEVLLSGFDVDDLFSGLGSLLMGTVAGSQHPVRALHTSFHDFVLDSDASGPFAISLRAESHLDLVDACLQILNSGLRFNICCLPSSFDLNDAILDLPQRVNEHVSPGLQYACRAAASHLVHSTGAKPGARMPRIRRSVERFFEEKLLFWMEACSCMRLGPDVPTAELQRYLVWIKNNNAEGLEALARDAIKFDNRFRDAIAASAPQVYISGLVFLPRRSQVRRAYRRSFSHLCKLAGNAPEDDWPPGEPFIIHTPAEVLAMSISPDGQYIASGLKDGTVCVWGAITGRQVGAAHRGHEDIVSAVAYSPNGEVIASASKDRTIRLWEASTGMQICGTLTGHTHHVYSVVFSPDGKRLASASNDCTVRLWDPAIGKQIGLTMGAHTKSVWSVAFSPDGKVLASGSEDCTIRLWDTATCQQLGEPLRSQYESVTSVAFSCDGKHLMTCTGNTTVRIWDVASRQQVREALGHGAWPVSIAFSPDGSRVASGALDDSVRLWDVESGCQVGEALEGHDDAVTAVAFSPDGTHIVSGSTDCTIRIWELPSVQHKSPPKHHNRQDICLSITFSPDGRLIASAMLDGTIVLWDASTGQQVGYVLRGHEDRVTSVSFSPDGRYLASGSFDCTVRLWDVGTGQRVGAVRREPSDVHRVHHVTFSPDGKHVLSGSDYGSLRIWTAAVKTQGYKVRTIWPSDSMNAVLSAAYSPDGSRIACAVQNDPGVHLCDASSGSRVGTAFSGHSGTITVVAYSPDGKLLATGSEDHTVRVWDAMTGHPVVDAQTGHAAAITYVSFSPDGGRVISCANDGTIRVWDTMTGKQIGSALRGHYAAVDSVAFAPDGRHVVSSAVNCSVRMWDTRADEEDWIRRHSESAPPGQTMDPPRSNFELASNLSLDDSGWLKAGSAHVLWVPQHLRRLRFACSPQHVMFIPPTQPHVDIDVCDAALGRDWAQIFVSG